MRSEDCQGKYKLGWTSLDHRERQGWVWQCQYQGETLTSHLTPHITTHQTPHIRHEADKQLANYKFIVNYPRILTSAVSRDQM